MSSSAATSSRAARRAAGALAPFALAILTAALGLPAERPTAVERLATTEMGGIHPTSLPIIDNDLTTLSRRSPAASCNDALTQEHLCAGDAHEVATGRNVRVAVLDGGFDLDHSSLRGHLVERGYDALDGDNDAHDPGNGRDDDRDGVVDRAAGHGTFVAGMVLLAAPEATIIPVRVRCDEGHGSDAALLKGLRYAEKQAVDVVNLSVSSASAQPSELHRQFERMRAAGIAVIVSAGNDGRDSLSALADCEAAIAVIACDGQDCVATFSNRSTAKGAAIVAAPGVALRGPYVAGKSARWSGTSFSAGLVSGAAALLRQLQPDLSGRELQTKLCHACEPAWIRQGVQAPFGRINLQKVTTR